MSIFLVVDDSAVDRMMFKGLIERVAGYSVVEAENGMDALDKLAAWNPDVVVTDLQMPKMNGLDLVKQMRLDYPKIPVLLATGHGSNDIANQALELGAAGYIPKSKLSDLLIPTLRNIVARKNCEAHFVKLMECGRELRYHFVLDNNRDLFAPLIDLCKSTLEGVSCLEYLDVIRVGIAIEQALHNALFRGNLEIPAEVAVPFGDEMASDDLRRLIKEQLQSPQIAKRRIEVDVTIDPTEFVCVIRDGGPGFTPELAKDLDDKQSGRGLQLMCVFVDEVSFNAKGNEVTLRHAYAARHPEKMNGKPTAPRAEFVIGRLTSVASGKQVELRLKKLVVGSSRSCHVALSGSDVAKHHCILRFKKDRWYVTKMPGDHILMVNEKITDHVKLDSGDVIQVGGKRLKLEY
ncbi:MAG TPA: response regulator [Pirellulaceae bacterium]|nr:response regulator [Pirellulaceae bacterium]HMO92796.1 response regulator [Pirellulaceae bacterium]HMP69378.1 response regulator [Pirellulaceae bacterium]